VAEVFPACKRLEDYRHFQANLTMYIGGSLEERWRLFFRVASLLRAQSPGEFRERWGQLRPLLPERLVRHMSEHHGQQGKCLLERMRGTPIGWSVMVSRCQAEP